MNTLKSRAFTIIEVMVVVVVISIIATMSILGYGSVQRDARDSARSSKATVVSEALEKYYDKNHEYPSVASLAGQSISTVKQKLNLQDEDTLVFPSGTAGASAIVSSGPSSTRLVYAGSPGSASCQTDVNGYCDSFQLQYISEVTGTTVVINNRQGVDYVAAVVTPTGPSAPVVSAVGTSTTSINVSWGTSSGTAPITYTVQYGTTASYGSAACSATSATSCALTGLAASTSGTLYYIRVVATNPYGTASGTTSASTNPSASGVAPTAPAVTATTQSSSSISVSWSASSGTAPISYSVSGSGNALSCTSSPCLVSGLAASTTYTFSVTASNAYGSATGSASATTSASAPSCTAPSTPVVNGSPASYNSAQISWSPVSGCTPMNYVVAGSGTASSCSASPCTITGLAASSTYTFSVTASNAGGTATGYTTISTPPAPVAPSMSLTAGAINGFGNTQLSWTASGYPAGTTYTAAASTGGNCAASTSTSGSCTLNTGTCWLNNTITLTARNSGGTTIASTTAVAALYNTKPPAPTIGSNFSATQTSLTPNWNSIGSATYYQVRYQRLTPTSGTVFSAGDFITNNSILISGLVSATTYRITVFSSNCYAKVSGGGTVSNGSQADKATN